MIIRCGWNEKNVLAIPTAAHSPARACRVLPRSVPDPGGGYRFSSYLYTEFFTQRPGGWRWNVMILPPRDTAVFVLFQENRLGPGIWFFFLAGSPTWLLKAAWTKTRTDSIYLYNILYSRVRLVCFSPTPSLPASQFHNNHSLFFFSILFFTRRRFCVFNISLCRFFCITIKTILFLRRV